MREQLGQAVVYVRYDIEYIIQEPRGRSSFSPGMSWSCQIPWGALETRLLWYAALVTRTLEDFTTDYLSRPRSVIL